ncbi:MAG: hypothetical protein HC822_26555 [Oscillochloris sp.]|nr:hypothetical protein [Oscillochloris sp.]
MRLQRFANLHNWNIVGETVIHKDRFARFYADGIRIATARPEGVFTALQCRDGNIIYVMTSDWKMVWSLPITA